MGGILNKVRSSQEFTNLPVDDPKIYTEAYAKYHDGANVKPETREFSQQRIIPIQEEFIAWMEAENIYQELEEPSYKIDTERASFPKCTL